MESSESDAPPITELRPEFKPVEKVWPSSWYKHDVENAVYVTFGLFAEPSNHDMSERLAFIENHPSEFPCRAIRRCWNVKTQPEFDDNIVEDFRTAYPDCDKTDNEIKEALLRDIRTKNKILVQAAKEDSTVTKGVYRMNNPQLRGSTIIRYPKFKDAAQNTGRHDDPLAAIPKYTDYGDKLKVVKARRRHQVMTAMTVGTPTPDYTDDTAVQMEQDGQFPAAADARSHPDVLPPNQSSNLSTRRPASVPPAPSSSIGSETINEVMSETRRAPMAPIVYPNALQSPRSATAEEFTSRTYARAPALLSGPAPSSDPASPSVQAQTSTSTALAAPVPPTQELPLAPSALWTRSGLQYPAGTWQPSDGHGDPSSSSWLLYDPRGPLPTLDMKAYSTHDGRMMAFPAYVDLSDRAFGHVIVSTVSYRAKRRYWPRNFRKDAHIVKGYQSKGAGYFFLDGRVGVIDTIKLQGGNYRGPITYGWNLPNGSAKSTAHIQDLAPSGMGILNCFIPHTVMDVLSRQVYRADGTGNTALPPIPPQVQPSKAPKPINQSTPTDTGRTTSGWTAMNTSSAQTIGSTPTLATASRHSQPASLQAGITMPPPVQAPFGNNNVQPTRRVPAATRASSPTKGSSKHKSKVSKEDLVEESRWLREDLERYEKRSDRQKRRLSEIESILESPSASNPSVPNARLRHGRATSPIVNDPSVPNVRLRYGRPTPTPSSPARQAAPPRSTRQSVNRGNTDSRRGEATGRAAHSVGSQESGAYQPYQEQDGAENDDADSIESNL